MQMTLNTLQSNCPHKKEVHRISASMQNHEYCHAKQNLATAYCSGTINTKKRFEPMKYIFTKKHNQTLLLC
jgi:hypothetical protein